ncbi:hypothetical protein L6452_24608 [Arctium lappa]|uniref:Uncharacterized protein n=1 Tax=Arctium lappa TaxID=4217 RepID=A0ACB9AAX1_ARCLA|nr:hypothetical protein L6452_24608 [Arctium lappa]
MDGSSLFSPVVKDVESFEQFSDWDGMKEIEFCKVDVPFCQLENRRWIAVKKSSRCGLSTNPFDLGKKYEDEERKMIPPSNFRRLLRYMLPSTPSPGNHFHGSSSPYSKQRIQRTKSNSKGPNSVTDSVLHRL